MKYVAAALVALFGCAMGAVTVFVWLSQHGPEKYTEGVLVGSFIVAGVSLVGSVLICEIAATPGEPNQR